MYCNRLPSHTTPIQVRNSMSFATVIIMLLSIIPLAVIALLVYGFMRAFFEKLWGELKEAEEAEEAMNDLYNYDK